MLKNPKVELCCVAPDGRWICVAGQAFPDRDPGARARMLEENAALSGMYNLDDGIFEVLYLDHIQSVIYSFTAEPEVLEREENK